MAAAPSPPDLCNDAVGTGNTEMDIVEVRGIGAEDADAVDVVDKGALWVEYEHTISGITGGQVALDSERRVGVGGISSSRPGNH
jgi:hypothetical protein